MDAHSHSQLYLQDQVNHGMIVGDNDEEDSGVEIPVELGDEEVEPSALAPTTAAEEEGEEGEEEVPNVAQLLGDESVGLFSSNGQARLAWLSYGGPATHLS